MPASLTAALKQWLRYVEGPELPEPIPEAHWRFGARANIWLCSLVVVVNLVFRVGIATLASAMLRDYDRFLLLNMPGHGLVIALSLWVLRTPRSERHYRAVTLVSFAGLLWTAFTALWNLGSVTNGMGVTFVVLTIGVARGFFDARMGLWTLFFATTMHAALVILEILGVVPASPGYFAPASLSHTSTTLRVVGLVWVEALYVGTFALFAGFARRFRRSEHARAVERSEARRAQERLVEEVRMGRLSGHVLEARYELQEVLGRGGMGEVYQARDLESGARVAVKVLHSHLEESRTMIERFQREAAAASRLPSEHVAKVLGFGHDADAGHFIVMELLIGEDLAALLRRRGALPCQEVVRLVAEIAHAPEAAHAAAIVHRDVKPQNVFLISGTAGRAVQVELLDFGVCRLLDAVGGTLTMNAMMLGSPGYLAP